MNKRFFILFLIALVGVGLSTLSLEQFVSARLGLNLEGSFCSMSEHIDCAKVHASPWSMILEIPLASYGIGFYLLVASMSFLGLVSMVLSKEQSRDFIFLSSLIASIASVGLFYVSEFLIGALCPVCIAMYVTNFALTAVSWNIPPDSGFFHRIGNAVRAGISVLAIWIPRATPASGFFSKIIAILLICFSLVSIVASHNFMKFYLLRKDTIVVNPNTGEVEVVVEQHTEEQAVNQVINKYVKEWEAQPVISFSVVRNQVVSGDQIKGKEGSPIQIIEFSDFECPHCQQLGAALAQLNKQYPNAFELVHKDFPLDSSCNKYSSSMHIGACKAAEFARCAGEQGKFWSVAEYFFQTGVPEEKTERAVLDQLMKTADFFGLDSDGLRECVISGRQLEKIKADADLGEKLQIQGTPSVWINGKFLSNPHPDIVRSIIESSVQKNK